MQNTVKYKAEISVSIGNC